MYVQVLFDVRIDRNVSTPYFLGTRVERLAFTSIMGTILRGKILILTLRHLLPLFALTFADTENFSFQYPDIPLISSLSQRMGEGKGWGD